MYKKHIIGDNNNDFSNKNKISNGRVFRYCFHIKYDNHIYLFSRSLCQQQRRQTVLYSNSMPLSYAINIQDNKTEFNVDI